MAFLMTEIEVTHPLPTIAIPEGHQGVALLLRCHERPVGFAMVSVPAGGILGPPELGELIGQDAGSKILQEILRQELLGNSLLNDLDRGDAHGENGSGSVTIDRKSRLSVTVAVCTRNRPEMVARCLNSLRQLEPRVADLVSDFEILVIDNAPSDDRTRDVVLHLPQARYIREPRPGLNFARNRALYEARGEILAFLDDDVTVDRGWLDGLIEAWGENPDAAGLTGLVLPYELRTQAQILFEQRGGFRRGFDKICYGPTLRGNRLYPGGAGIFGAGCNMAFRRDVLAQLGGFDEALDTGTPLPGGGDLDMFYRIIRAGFSLVYEPRCLVFHEHRGEMKALRDQYRWSWGLGFMAFVTKCYKTDHTQRSKIIQLTCWWFAHKFGLLQRRVRGNFVLPAGMILGELWGGVVGLLGGYSRSLRRTERIRRQFE